MQREEVDVGAGAHRQPVAQGFFVCIHTISGIKHEVLENVF